MTTPIKPETLKAYRAHKKWSQQELVDATRGKVSLPTIKRIEANKAGVYEANDRVAKNLAEALGITTKELASPFSSNENTEDLLEAFGYRYVRSLLSHDALLAFDLVHQIYGISMRAQVEMAPLFSALLAEGSLAWRREKLAKIEQSAAVLEFHGKGHLRALASIPDHVEEEVEAERNSISEKDIFGKHVGESAYEQGYDPAEQNPFTDYLKEYAKSSSAINIIFGEMIGSNIYFGLPQYQIDPYVFDRITDNNPQAKFALLGGYARLRDLPKDLFDDDKTAERIEWLISHVPIEELASREKYNRLKAVLSRGEGKEASLEASRKVKDDEHE